MPNNYEFIKQLIDLWDLYEKDNHNINLLDFAEWVTVKLKEEPALNKKISQKKHTTERTEHFDYMKNLDDKAKFIEYISRIARLQEFYTRKFFIDMSINNRLEFLFLYTINQMGSAKKTDLINIHLVEYTTGMDTLRRLINNGLVEEMQHNNDKRAKMLVLTKKGKKTVEQVNKRMDSERNMFLAGISANKWKKTLPVLEEINHFHNNIYQNYNEKTYSELLNLMDSLKHLHSDVR